MSAYIIGILSTGDTYRLALKGILPPSPSVLTDYRFSCTAPTKHHSGLAARQSVPLKLACFVLLLQWHFYFISLFSFFLCVRDSVEKVRVQLQLHIFTPLLQNTSKLHELLLSKAASQTVVSVIDLRRPVGLDFQLAVCRLFSLSPLIRKRFSDLG